VIYRKTCDSFRVRQQRGNSDLESTSTRFSPATRAFNPQKLPIIPGDLLNSFYSSSAMPQIERPTHRQPLKDLPLSLFIHPEYMKTTSLLGKKRPYSPSSIVSPSKRRLLAVEGVLSPRSPFKKAAADLHRALPSATSPARNLLDDFARPNPRHQFPIPLDFHPNQGREDKPVVKSTLPSLLAPAQELRPGGSQPKPRVAAEPSKAEAELLAALKAAPKPSYYFLPGSGHARPIRPKENDPEEDHYPGFDICVDGQSDHAPEQSHETNGMDPSEDEDEEDASKENKPLYDVSCFCLVMFTTS
jgi:hypothetical protein